jgi:hypothetical protein
MVKCAIVQHLFFYEYIHAGVPVPEPLESIAFRLLYLFGKDTNNAVFQIRGILVRIRILGSVNFITDPVPALDPVFIVSVFQDANKTNFFLICFDYTVLSVCTFTCVFKDKVAEIKVFSRFFCLLMERSGS